MSEYPIEVLKFAVRHKYDDIANESAPLLLHIASSKLYQILPLDVFSAWVRTEFLTVMPLIFF